MKCPSCGYISFKVSKKCDCCGAEIKGRNGSNGTASDSANVFSILAVPVKQQTSQSARENSGEEDLQVATAEMEPESFNPTLAQETPESLPTESKVFNLDLSDAEKDIPDSPAPENNPQSGLHSAGLLEEEFNTKINLEEIEVEGLGFEDPHFDHETDEVSDNRESPKSESDDGAIAIESESAEEMSTAPIDNESEAEPDQAESALNAIEPEIQLDGVATDEPSINDAAEETESQNSTLEEQSEIIETSQDQAKIPEMGTEDLGLTLEEDVEIVETSQDQTKVPEVEIEDLGLTLEEDIEITETSQDQTKVPEVAIEDLGLTLEEDIELKPPQQESQKTPEIEDMGLTLEDPEPNSPPQGN